MVSVQPSYSSLGIAQLVGLYVPLMQMSGIFLALGEGRSFLGTRRECRQDQSLSQ